MTLKNKVTPKIFKKENNNSLNKLSNNKLVSPIICYSNAGLSRKAVIKDCREKSGIYRWVNNINKKSYIGSGVDLAKRLTSYYNKNKLKKNPRPIHNALLVYGHSNFTIEILEFCSKMDVINREQYYLDLLKPEYNILKTAYSLLGFRHSPENIEKFKLRKISLNHKKLLSLIHKGKIVSQETRNKLAIATTNYKKNNLLSPESLASLRAKTIEREGVSVQILNTLTNEIKKFTNQTEAGQFLGVTRQAVYNAIKRDKPIKKIFIISKL